MKPGLTYSMSVSVDGFIADRDGDFDWGSPRQDLFRFHTALIDVLCGYERYRRARDESD